MKEMRQLGDFILMAAQMGAEAQGVTAVGVIREGEVLDKIVALCHETGADYVVFGRPQTRDGDDRFTHELLDQFACHIEEETGATVVYPKEGGQS
jgi:RNase H-fold protein (predicted Holliday junction resolvase)